MLTTRYDSRRSISRSIQRSAIACRTCNLSQIRRPVPDSRSVFAKRVRSSSARRDWPELPIDERSKSSVVVAMYHPRFNSPSSPERGMRTLSKKTSLNASPPAMLIRGRTVTPGVFMSIKK